MLTKILSLLFFVFSFLFHLWYHMKLLAVEGQFWQSYSTDKFYELNDDSKFIAHFSFIVLKQLKQLPRFVCMMSYEMKISFAASVSWCVRKEMFAASCIIYLRKYTQILCIKLNNHEIWHIVHPYQKASIETHTQNLPIMRQKRSV